MSDSLAIIRYGPARMHLGLLPLSWTTALGQMRLLQVAPAAAGALATSAETNPAAGAIGADPTIGALEARVAEARAHLARFGEAGVTNAPPGVSVQDVWT